MLATGRFAEDLALTFGDSVAADDDATFKSRGDIAGFLVCQSGDQFGWRFAVRASRFG
jgi:hypothetical protein